LWGLVGRLSLLSKDLDGCISGRWPKEVLGWELVKLLAMGSRVVVGLWPSSVGDTGELGARW